MALHVDDDLRAPVAPLPHAARLGAFDRCLLAVELFLAASALGGAIALIAGAIDLEDATDELPWRSPVFGGVALLLVCGLPPLAAVAAVLRRARWAPAGHLVVGLMLLGWIVVEVGYVGYGSWLQVAYGALGALLATVAAWRLGLAPTVGVLGVVASAVYVWSDAVEALQGGFSHVQLAWTLLGEAAVPLVVIGLAAAQRPVLSRLGWAAAIAYAWSYVYFTGTVVYAWRRDVPDYDALVDDLGPVMTAHGALMVIAGIAFAFATHRAGRLPNAAAGALAAGVVLVAATQGAPDPLPLLAAAVRAVAIAALAAPLIRSAAYRPSR